MDGMTIVILLCGFLLVIFGGLVGHSLSDELSKNEIRRGARIRREVGEQWRELQADRARAAAHHCRWCESSRTHGVDRGSGSA